MEKKKVLRKQTKGVATGLWFIQYIVLSTFQTTWARPLCLPPKSSNYMFFNFLFQTTFNVNFKLFL